MGWAKRCERTDAGYIRDLPPPKPEVRERMKLHAQLGCATAAHKAYQEARPSEFFQAGELIPTTGHLLARSRKR